MDTNGLAADAALVGRRRLHQPPMRGRAGPRARSLRRSDMDPPHTAQAPLRPTQRLPTQPENSTEQVRDKLTNVTRYSRPFWRRFRSCSKKARTGPVGLPVTEPVSRQQTDVTHN